MKIHELAELLNQDLQCGGSPLFEMLSKFGKRAYFPSKGILGQSAEARGKEINATIGTALEDDGTPLCLECVTKTTNLPPNALLYSPSFGLKDLRERWLGMELGKNPSLQGKAISLPVVTHALTHGLSVAGRLFLDSTDAVITPDLYWDNYELVFCEATGARIKTFPMFDEHGAFHVAEMEKLLLAPGDKKVLLLNFPNNPTGYTATETDAIKIRKSILKAARAGKRIVVFLDDAYFGLVYEPGVCKESLFASLCDLHRNVLAVKLDGATKEDYVWGVRVGFITFGAKGAKPAQYKALEQKAAGVVRGTISNPTNIGQKILLAAYADPNYISQKHAKFETLLKRYRKIRSIFAAHPEYSDSFRAMPFNSGYFMCVKPIGVTPEAVRQQLLSHYSTGVIILSGLIRLAFSSVPFAKLEQLYANIHAAIQDLRSK